MKIDEMIENFRLGKFELDCKRIVLTQNKETGERYEGKGYIKQDTDGVLIYNVRGGLAHSDSFLGFLSGASEAIMLPI